MPPPTCAHEPEACRRPRARERRAAVPGRTRGVPPFARDDRRERLARDALPVAFGRKKTRLPDDAHRREHSDEEIPDDAQWREHSDEKRQGYPKTPRETRPYPRTLRESAHATRTADLERMVRKTENFVSRMILILALCFSRRGGSNCRAKPRP